jgi:hypothetical protein
MNSVCLSLSFLSLYYTILYSSHVLAPVFLSQATEFIIYFGDRLFMLTVSFDFMALPGKLSAESGFYRSKEIKQNPITRETERERERQRAPYNNNNRTLCTQKS